MNYPQNGYLHAVTIHFNGCRSSGARGPVFRGMKTARVQELGRRIQTARKAAGLTQEQLAETADVNVKTIRGVEQGRSEPELATMRRIAQALGTSVDDLAGADDARSV